MSFPEKHDSPVDPNDGIDKAQSATSGKEDPQAASISLPEHGDYLPLALSGSCWDGRKSFENVVIFGDSYSKSLSGSKTWVDHFVAGLRKSPGSSSVHVHNFALPGATAKYNLPGELAQFFLAFPERFAADGAPVLDPSKTSFVFYIGINDCGTTDADELESVIETVIDAIHKLYVKIGARNFLLIDVPPINRSPAAINADFTSEIEERVTTWNDLLQSQASEFHAGSESASMFIFSSHRTLVDVFDDPTAHGFEESDSTEEGGGIWEDELHLTADMHRVLAERLLTSLRLVD